MSSNSTACLLLAWLLAATATVADSVPDGVRQGQALLAPVHAVLGEPAAAYEAGDRRDPFVDPRPELTEPGEPQAAGLAGLAIDDLAVDGITLVGADPIAMLSGSDGLGYTVRVGTRLRDGRVSDIDFDRGVVSFEQQNPDSSALPRMLQVERSLKP